MFYSISKDPMTQYLLKIEKSFCNDNFRIHVLLFFLTQTAQSCSDRYRYNDFNKLKNGCFQYLLFMTTLVVYYSCILTVKVQILTKYRRNQINFVFFVLPVMKGSVGLILVKSSDMRISIPFDLSSRPFIPLPCFIRSRRPLPLLVPSLVFTPRCSAQTTHEGFLSRVLSVFLTPHTDSYHFFKTFF